MKSLTLDRERIVDRVNFYNKINFQIDIPEGAKKIRHIPMSKSMYYYDFKEIARYFPRDLMINFEFGDIKDFPEKVTFLKSRPIGVDHRNGILVKINKFRHYYMPRDGRSFFDKKPIAVWRGGSHNPKRITLVRRHKDNPICDVALTAGEFNADASKFLAPNEQMAFRYIICIEGNDLASNLVRTMASNSLCLMPRPTNESWFLESRLVPGRHYVELDENFEDLEDTILYYERHPGEAQEIVRNANRHVGQFLDSRRERAIGLLVMYKYFIATRQIEPDETIAEMIWP